MMGWVSIFINPICFLYSKISKVFEQLFASVMAVSSFYASFHPHNPCICATFHVSRIKVHIKLFFVAVLPPEHGSSPNVNLWWGGEGGNIIGYISNSQLFLPVCAQASYLGVEVGGGGTLSPSRSRGEGRGGEERELNWEQGPTVWRRNRWTGFIFSYIL